MVPEVGPTAEWRECARHLEIHSHCEVVLVVNPSAKTIFRLR